VIALGHTATGVMGSDDALVQEVLDAAKRAGEPGWPLPLWDDYKELIKSDVADIKNSGGRPAGTITAALFLKEFAESYPWVHLDIAGTAYTESDLGTIPRGPTGVPVGTFVEFVRGRTR
jgi:leucyl aminopeptidase